MTETHHHDLGFGSEYEKFILRSMVKKIVNELSLESVCEYPTNNLMGDNTEIFSGLNLRIDRLARPEQANAKYDLVWNFCEIEQQINPFRLMKEMLLLTQKYLMIILQNRRNPGVPLHRFYHNLSGKTWNHGSIALMSPDLSVNFLSGYGRIMRTGYFDVPWFILDIYESGNFLRRLIPKTLAGSMLQMKKSRFEDLPVSFKKHLAHHVYVLFEKYSVNGQKQLQPSSC